MTPPEFISKSGKVPYNQLKPAADEDVYTFQVRRMRAMKGYPKDDAELIRVAREHSTVLDLCEAISAFIDYAPECPQPSELRGSLDVRKPPPPDKIEQWKKEGLTQDLDFSKRILAAMNGKNNPDQYNTVRWESIHDALEYVERPERETDKQGRTFWNWYLSWAEECHPEEVAAIRAGRRPSHPDPEAYKLRWENLPDERRQRILGNQRLRTPPATQEEIDRIQSPAGSQPEGAPAMSEFTADELRDLADHEAAKKQTPTITVVVFRRRDSDPFEARVLQEHRLGPNLSPRTGTAEMARSAAERRIRLDGWKGEIKFEEGLPDSIRSLPVDSDPAPSRRGLRKHKKDHPVQDLPFFS